MNIAGTEDLQRSAPTAQISQLEQIFSELGYQNDEVTLTIVKVSNGSSDTVGIHFTQWSDRVCSLTLQADAGAKRYSCALASQLPEDTGERLTRRLREKLRSSMSAPPASTPGLELLKVFNLSGEQDKKRFPNKSLATLTEALIALELDEDVVLRFSAFLRGNDEAVGVHIEGATGGAVTLTLQDYPQSTRAQCTLAIKNGATGEQLREQLVHQLSKSSISNAAPAPGSRAHENGTGEKDGETPMPPIGNDPTGSSRPEAASVRTTLVVKVKSTGFSADRGNVERYLARLRQEYPDSALSRDHAARILGEFVETKAGVNANQSTSLIVSALVRLGYLVPTSDDEDLVTPLLQGERPVPRETSRHKGNGAVAELDPEHPVRQRIGRLSDVLQTDAQMRADIASKRGRAEGLRTQSATLAAQAEVLEAEAAALENHTLSAEDLDQVDALLQRLRPAKSTTGDDTAA
jgi:hypothetical protein